MNNKPINFKIFIGACAFIMASCTQKEPAPVEQYGKNHYGRTGVKESSSVKPAFIIVKSGDSLLSLSNKYKISYSDLLKANNLSEDHVLKAGEKIRLPKANYHKVQEGETLSKIARQYNIPIQKLAEMNNMNEPYRIRLGQLISIPNNNFIASNDVESSNSLEEDNSSYSPMKIKQLDAPDAQSINTDESNTVDESNAEESIPEENEEELPSLKKDSEESEQENELPAVSKEPDENKPLAVQASKFIWPTEGTVISNFGPLENGGKNDGINIESPEGTPIKAAASGVVVYSGNGLKGYGNLIILKHADSTLTAYAHQADLIVAKDAKVKQGQVIGHVGATGNVSSPQLHFAVRKGKKPVNPLNFLPMKR
ncbi:MAG: peptidoglycan DD-metalloendopeptidase family protein [Alphaproteobacteria bacterium]